MCIANQSESQSCANDLFLSISCVAEIHGYDAQRKYLRGIKGDNALDMELLKSIVPLSTSTPPAKDRSGDSDSDSYSHSDSDNDTKRKREQQQSEHQRDKRSRHNVSNDRHCRGESCSSTRIELEPDDVVEGNGFGLKLQTGVTDLTEEQKRRFIRFTSQITTLCSAAIGMATKSMRALCGEQSIEVKTLQAMSLQFYWSASPFEFLGFASAETGGVFINFRALEGICDASDARKQFAHVLVHEVAHLFTPGERHSDVWNFVQMELMRTLDHVVATEAEEW